MKTLESYIAESSSDEMVYLAIDFEKTKIGGVYMFVVAKKKLPEYFENPTKDNLKFNSKGIKKLAEAFNSPIEEVTGFKVLCCGRYGDKQFDVTEII